MKSLTVTVLLLACVMALPSCMSVLPAAPPQVVQVPGPKLQPVAAEILEPEAGGFLENLIQRFSLPKPSAPTASPGSSQAVRP